MVHQKYCLRKWGLAILNGLKPWRQCFSLSAALCEMSLMLVFCGLKTDQNHQHFVYWNRSSLYWICCVLKVNYKINPPYILWNIYFWLIFSYPKYCGGWERGRENSFKELERTSELSLLHRPEMISLSNSAGQSVSSVETTEIVYLSNVLNHLISYIVGVLCCFGTRSLTGRDLQPPYCMLKFGFCHHVDYMTWLFLLSTELIPWIKAEAAGPTQNKSTHYQCLYRWRYKSTRYQCLYRWRYV